MTQETKQGILKRVVVYVPIAITVLGIACYYGQWIGRVEAHEKRITQIEIDAATRLRYEREAERQRIELKKDVEWIRDFLEHRYNIKKVSPNDP